MAINNLDVFGANPIDIAGIDITAVGDALKVKYNPARVAFVGYDNNPFYGMVPKTTDFTGRNYVIAVHHTAGAGVGPNITLAQVRGSHENDAFVLTRVNKYGTNLISGDVWKAARDNPSSMFNAYTKAWDAPIYSMTRDVCLELYGAGTGVRGSFTTTNGGAQNDLGGATGTLTTITLDNADEIVHFERNWEYDIRATTEGGGASVAGADKTITAVDRRAGTVTFGAATGTLAADTTYYIFRDGYYTAAGTANKLALMGLQGWLPEEVTSTAFFGVDRTADTTRLGGLFHNGSGSTVTEAVLDAGKLAYREGARPDYLFVNPEQMTELQKELQGKSFYEPTEARSQYGFVAYKGFKINAASGSVTVLSDPNCPVNRGFMLTMNTWKLATMGPAIGALDLDGLAVLRAASEDAYEMRFGLYGNLGCESPGENVHIKFA